MRSHSHTALCDRDWVFYHEVVDYDVGGSAKRYLDMVFDMFDMSLIPRSAIESVMAKRVDDNSSDPVYFLYDDIVYLWMICDSCRLCSLN